MEKGESKNTDLAGRIYDTSDYRRDDEFSNGLAVTHEQASDSYTEGDIGGKIGRTTGLQDESGKKSDL